MTHRELAEATLRGEAEYPQAALIQNARNVIELSDELDALHQEVLGARKSTSLQEEQIDYLREQLKAAQDFRCAEALSRLRSLALTLLEGVTDVGGNLFHVDLEALAAFREEITGAD